MPTMKDGVAAEVAGDYPGAYRIYRELAESGNVEAWLAIGDLFFRGKGVPQDFKAAMTWFRRAAEEGNASAQAHLGNCFFKGKGVVRNIHEAYFWLNLAAGGHVRFTKERDRIAPFLTPAEVTEIQGRCSDWVVQLETRRQLEARKPRRGRRG